MIDEKKLIEKIKERIEIHKKDYQAFKNYSGDRKIKDIAKWDECTVIIDLIKDQPKVGEWIPVSERLPKVEGEMYWTTHEDGSIVQHGWSERHGFIYNWELGEKRAKMGTVIAWMPMFKPEPYKE